MCWGSYGGGGTNHNFIFLTKIRSLTKKMDEFKLQGAMDNIMKNSCLPETANELAGNTPHLDDKSQDTGKGRGGDVVCLRQQQLVY